MSKPNYEVLDYQMWRHNDLHIRYYYLTGLLYIARGKHFWKAIRTVRTSPRDVVVLQDVALVHRVVFTATGVEIYYRVFKDAQSTVHSFHRAWEE